jgi:hypothetical protein
MGFSGVQGAAGGVVPAAGGLILRIDVRAPDGTGFANPQQSEQMVTISPISTALPR